MKDAGKDRMERKGDSNFGNLKVGWSLVSLRCKRSRWLEKGKQEATKDRLTGRIPWQASQLGIEDSGSHRRVKAGNGTAVCVLERYIHLLSEGCKETGAEGRGTCAGLESQGPGLGAGALGR